MADVNANIGVHIDTSAALAELKNLQRQLATFHSSVARNSAAATQAQKGLQTNLLNSINATGKFHAQMGLVRSSTESFTHALETNKLSMREYFRFAGGSTKTFGRLFKQEFNTIGKVAEERVKKMQTQYIKMGRDASGAIQSMSITPRTLDMTNYANKTAVAAQKQALLNQLLKQGSTNLLNFGKNTQWAGRQLMVGFTIPLAYFGTMAAKTFMDLEKQAIRFKRVYGDMFTTTEETNKALADVQQLAEEFTKYGVAVAETMEMAANAAAMGKVGADLTAQVAQATRLAVLGGVEQAQALETTISVTNAFGVAAEDLANKINFLNAVENQTVVSIEDLTIAIPKAGPVVKQLGGEVEDLAFFLTAMKEGGINASEGANALKSGLASLINPSEKANKMLASMGININAIVEGNQGNIRETVIDFAQALDTLDPLNRARAIEQLFGKFQFSRLSTLFQNVTKDGTQAARVLDLAGASIEELAIMSERELGVLEDAISTDFKESIEQLKLAIAPIGKEFLKAITPVAKAIGGFLEKFNNLGDGTKKFIVVATTLVGVIGPVLLMTFGLLANGVANIIKLFITMRSGFLRAGSNTTLLAQQTQYLNTEQLEAATVAASLNQAHTRLTQSFAAETTAVRLLRQAYIDATIAAANFARANPGMMMPGFKPGMKGGGTGKKFASGTTKVVGGTAGKDSVPALLMPGEAVVPTDIAQNNKFKPLVEALVTGKIAQYGNGSTGVTFEGKNYSAQSGLKAKSVQDFLNSLQKNSDGTYNYKDPKNSSNNKNNISPDEIRRVMTDRSNSGKLNISELKEKLVLTADAKKANLVTKGPGQTLLSKKLNQLPGRGMSGTENEMSAIKKRLQKYGLDPNGKEMKRLLQIDKSHLTPAFDASGKKVFTLGNIVPDYGYVNNYISNSLKGKLGKHLSSMDSKQLKGLGIDPKEFKSLMAGNHPQTTASANTLRKISDYVLNYPGGDKALGRALNLNSSGVKNLMYQTDALNAGLSERLKTDFYKGGTGSRTIEKLLKKFNIAVSRNELLLDEKNRASIVTGSTGKPKPANMPMIGGSSKDTRIIPASKVNKVVPMPKFFGPKGFALGAAEGITRSGVPPIPFSSAASGMRVADSQVRELITAVNKNTLAVNASAKASKAAAKSTSKVAAAVTGSVAAGAGAGVVGGVIPPTLTPKEARQTARAERSQKIGRVAGPAAGALGMASMGAFMTGNTGMGMGLMGASAVASIVPMLANPLGIAVAAAATLAGGFFLLNKRMDDARKKQIEYIDSVTASTKKMQKIGEITGKVGASQIAQRQRETGVRANEFRTGYDREDNQFGTNFLASDIGKEIFKGFNDTVAKDGPKAAQLLATQLGAYISDGVMSAEQANSVARAIGINLGDMSISTNINGELRELVGPDGQDLLTNPLSVRLKIISTQAEMSNDLKNVISEFEGITKGDEYRGFVAQSSVANAKNLEIIQAQRDAQFQTNQLIIDNLEKQKTLTTDKTKQFQLEEQIVIAKGKQKSEDQVLAAKSKQIIKDAEDLYNLARNSSDDLPGSLGAAMASGAFIDALQAGIKSANKDNPFLNAFINKGASLDSVQLEAQINTAVLGGLLNIPTALKLMEMFAGTEEGEAKLKTVIETTVTTQDPGVFKTFMEIVSGKKIKPEITMAILTDQDKFEDRVNVLNKLKDFDGDSINLEVFVNDMTATGLDDLALKFKAIEKIKSPITIKTLAEISTITNDPDIDMSGLVDIWTKYENATDEIKKTVIQEYIAVFSSIGDEEVEDLIMNELARSDIRSPDRMDDRRRLAEKKYFTIDKDGEFKLDKDGKRIPTAKAAGALVSQRGAKAANEIPKDGSDFEDISGSRDTTLDDLLRKLKLTRNASINAQGGLEELRRVFKDSNGDITKFSGVIQQLNAAGADTGFIDFVSSLDNDTQKVYLNTKLLKKGIVELTEEGKIAMDLYKEAALGAFQESADSQITNINAQVNGFKRLTAAGVGVADSIKLIADAEFMRSLSQAKTVKELDTLIKKNNELKQAQMDLLLVTDPARAFKDRMEESLKYYDFLERQARASVKLEIDRINDLIDANERLIQTQERYIEENINRVIEQFNQDLNLIDRSITKINEKYDAQEKALQEISDINDDIAAKESSRISIADALTKGDISAAAKAIQEERQAAAQRAQEESSKLLQIAREKEIAKVTSASGLTRAQIEEKIYALEQQRLPLVAKIVKLQDDNYKLQNVTLRAQEDSLNATLKGIDAARFAYEQQVIAIEAAQYEANGFNGILLVAEATLLRMKAIWDSLNSKSAIKTPTVATGTSQEILQKSSLASANKEYFEKQVFPAVESGTIGGNELRDYAKAYSQAFKTNIIPLARGGMVPKYYASGGYSKGTDTIPAMLTPGEFVVRKNAVDSFGVNSLNKINDGSYGGSSVYNYSLNVNVKSDANPNDIARTVMTQIKQIDNQRIRTQRGA
jgi:TP901 family phage tail tape measure protein